jgi:hypothetical protein
VEIDPVASMRVWAVDVDIGGELMRIPPTPAADWMPSLMEGDILGILDLTDGIDFEQALIDGTVTIKDVISGVVKLLESAAGRSAWSTFALAALAKRQWSRVGADLARYSVKLNQISLSAALDAIYGALVKGMDEKGLARLDAALSRPPAEFQRALGLEPVGVLSSSRMSAHVPASAEQYVRVRPKTVIRKPQDRLPVPIEQPNEQPSVPVDNAPVDVGVSARATRSRQPGWRESYK